MGLNITLGSGKAVHAKDLRKASTLCGIDRIQKAFGGTSAEVTCKRCLKLTGVLATAAERTAYYAGLADKQDETLSQAAPAAETPAKAEKTAFTRAEVNAFIATWTGSQAELWQTPQYRALMAHKTRGDGVTRKYTICDEPDLAEQAANDYVAVTIDGGVYLVGPEQISTRSGIGYVEYWDSWDHGYTRRAYNDSSQGSLSRCIWEEQRHIRNAAR